MSSEVNPYAAPLNVAPQIPEAEGQQAFWQDGLLVVRKDATLGGRCVKCGAPTDYLLKRKFSWHTPWVFLLLLISIWVYIIVALIIRKKGTVHIGLCERHRARRRRAILIAWLVVLAGVSACFITALMPRGQDGWKVLLIVGGALLACGGALFGVFGVRTVWPKKIDKEFIWLKGVSPEFGAELPKSALAR